MKLEWNFKFDKKESAVREHASESKLKLLEYIIEINIFSQTNGILIFTVRYFYNFLILIYNIFLEIYGFHYYIPERNYIQL